VNTVINLKGRLMYYGWRLPWKLTSSDNKNSSDIWDATDNALINLHKRSVTQIHDKEGYRLYFDEKSVYSLLYVRGKSILLNPIISPGASKDFELPRALVWLSGRCILIELTNKNLVIRADPEEKVFNVYFSKESNFCDVPQGSESAICRAGQGKEACVFLRFADSGFCCEKYNTPEAIKSLEKLYKGQIVGRIGNCGLLGRRS
jgi:hypothetical protein